MALVPTVACLGSGVIAALACLFFPTKAHVLKLSSHIHNLTALPMSILLVFRFEESHNRWSTARNALENINANVLALAMCSASSREVKIAHSRIIHAIDEHEARMLGLLDAFCWYVDNTLMCGSDPHPANEPIDWTSVDLLTTLDRKAISTTADPVHWCFKNIISMIYTGLEKRFYSSETASGMFDAARAMLEDYHSCNMVVHQGTPAPFIVHMRTLLLAFCFTFPFTMIGKTSALGLVAKQFAISFSLLTVEACSREMEHPFGDDEADIPCRLILAETRASIRSMGHEDRSALPGKNCPSRQRTLIRSQLLQTMTRP